MFTREKEGPLDGKSFLPLLKGEQQSGRAHVFKEYHENARGTPLPMRSVQNKQFVYIFNPWHHGDSTFKSATLYTNTFRAMSKSKNMDIKERRNLFLKRPLEELYDVSRDPDCLTNLAESIEFNKIKKGMRKQLLDHMKEHQDPAAVALESFNRPDIIKKWIISVQQQSKKAWDDPSTDKKRHK